MGNVTVVVFNPFVGELWAVFFVPFLDTSLIVDMKWFEFVKFSLDLCNSVFVDIQMVGDFHVVME